MVLILHTFARVFDFASFCAKLQAMQNNEISCIGAVSSSDKQIHHSIGFGIYVIQCREHLTYKT